MAGRCLCASAVFWVKLSSVREKLGALWVGPSDLTRPIMLERRLLLGRWVGIGVFAIALGLHPLGANTMVAAYGVLALAFIYSLTLLRLIKRRHSGVLVGFVPTLVDGLLCALMLPLVGGFDSPYYAVLYAVVVSAGMRLGFARGLLLAAAIAAVDLLWRIGGGSGVDAAFTVRSGVLFMTVLLTSYLHDEALKSEAALAERLHHSEVLNSALEHQALYDLLTDLPNRTMLHLRIEEAITARRSEHTSVALLVIDLDRFKEVNDTFGHQYGDLLLQQIGPRFSDALEPGDTVARLGGDEFAVLLPAADAVRAEQVARKLLRTIDRSFSIADNWVDVGGSIGIALSPEHGADSDVLLRRADVAMYVAKQSGSGFAIYLPEQDQHSPDRLALIGELRRAIQNDELTLVYQPKVDLETRQCVGVEALVRWQHPQRGVIPPDRFIPLAEQTGLIKNVSRWVLNAALRQCREWRADGIEIPIAVNLSMRDLHDSDLPEIVVGLLKRWGVPPSQLMVEITENGLMADPARALHSIAALRLMGIRIAIDDFGTGYSSLAYLKRLPVDELKIDRSFVRELASDEHDLAIVRAAISLGHDLGLRIVAEGIEDAETWDRLRRLGCDVAQGYFIGRPMPASALVASLDRSQGVLAA
ncbi:MAG: EAL domain-containing protein [Chloroflexi bacterium]|nr:MAG: EAL domain-containing protein [Chloroflexota bacterium]